jgi:hypothetical protein
MPKRESRIISLIVIRSLYNDLKNKVTNPESIPANQVHGITRTQRP